MTVPLLLNSFRAASLMAILVLTAGPAAAQIPNTLLHLIPPQPLSMEDGAQLGFSVAVDGGYVVVGAPYDDRGAHDSGVVKVFDSRSGALLFLLPNPTATVNGYFGFTVAISGTRVVVGAYGNNTGAAGAGSAYVFDLASNTPTVPATTLDKPGPAVGDHFGVSVAISGTRVVVGAIHDDTGAKDAGSAYAYDLSGGSPSVPVATLNNPSPALEDEFGRSVAISGTRVVVGAWYDDTGAEDAGSVYQYDLGSGTRTVPVITLNNPEPAAHDYFGVSTAISGTRVVVGAYFDDAGALDAGSAYVYDLSSGKPSVPVVTLNNPSPEMLDLFGASVAISGTRVVIGRPYNDTGANDAGSAYVYDLDSGTPTAPVTTLNNPGPAADDWFGVSVAISGTQVVVGAVHDDLGATDAGSAYVYDITSDLPTFPVVTLVHPASAVHENFGRAVAVSGNWLVVGAPGDDTDGQDAGRVYVYDLASATPTMPVTTLKSPNPVAFDYFGVAVAISGSRVVVGAYMDDTGGQDNGAAYVFDLSSATPALPVSILSNPGPATGRFFGGAVAISGTRVVVGSEGDPTPDPSLGSAYVFDLTSATPAVPVAALHNPSTEPGVHFGWAVAILGTRVVVGSPYDPAGALASGMVYIYDLTSGTPPVPVTILNNPSPAEYDRFGNSVSISGSRVVVGAFGDDTGALDAGIVYAYDLASGTPTVPVTTLTNPDPAEKDYFGHSVAISGTRVAVVAWHFNMGAGTAGRGYVFDLSSSTPAVPVATLHDPSPLAGDGFETSVAIDGTTVAIGAAYDDTVATDKGFAFVFGPHPLDQDSDGLLDSWEIARFGTTTGHGALDDADHDGYNELLELALGLNPKVANTGGLPTVAKDNGYLTMTITKQPGVTYEVQSAGDLLPALPDSFSAASTTVLLNDATTLKVRDNSLIAWGPRRFMRVKVTASP